MNKDELRALLTSGIEAARNNNPILARQSFREVLAEDPNNELAWMWLAQVVDLDDQRREALQNVLRINPDNSRARDALRRLGEDTPDPNQVQSRLSQAAAGSSSAPTPRSAQDQPVVFVPKKTDKQNQPREMWASNRRSNDGNRLMFMLLIILVGVVLIIVGLVIAITQIVDTGVTETPTPTEALVAGGDQATAVVAPQTTLPPRATFVEILETATPPATLPPTAIPSQTPVPTETPIPDPPDGNLGLFYISGTGVSSVRGDGSNERNINVEAGDGGSGGLGVRGATLSPDGNTLVFSASTGGGQEIFKANANGSGAEQLTNLSARQTLDPSVSPNGQYVAFASDTNGNLDIYVVSINGGIPRRVTSTPDNERQPVWSPNGQYLAYAVSPTSLDSEIYVIEIGDISELSQPLVENNTNSAACQITRGDRSAYSPSFSPDGTRIAFVSDRASFGETDVYIMNVDGTGLQIITANDGKSQEQSVSWSPDGRWLAITTSRNAAVINESGFDSASGDSSGLIGDDTPTPPVPTEDTSDAGAGDTSGDTPTEGDTGDTGGDDTSTDGTDGGDNGDGGDTAQEPTVEPTAVPPTVVPTQAPIVNEETTLWLYDIEAKLWYQVTDSEATNVFWNPSSGSEVEVADEIHFNCMQ